MIGLPVHYQACGSWMIPHNHKIHTEEFTANYPQSKPFILVHWLVRSLSGDAVRGTAGPIRTDNIVRQDTHLIVTQWSAWSWT